ncbi:MAG: class I SAM-dependent methyltransferase [bacterium]
MSVSDLAAYHKLITDSYDQRSESYNDSLHHREQAQQRVDDCPPPVEGRVLDVGTGTGAAAFHAAGYVGEEGEVLGVDLSQGMISKASALHSESGLSHVYFMQADGERLQHEAGYFDRIYCASAVFWMSDKQQVLKHWYSLLKPRGQVGFHAWPEHSYVFAYVES